MKLKKLTALLLAGIMTLSLAACGGGSSDSSSSGDSSGSTGGSSSESAGEASGSESSGELSGKLTVWTLAADLEQFADKFAEENPGVEMEVVVIAPGDYPTKVETALLGGDSSVDIIVGEPKMLQSMYEAEFFANLDDFGAKDYEGQIVDYVWQVGQDNEGIQRAISYQITPIGFFYRRDIAEKVFGYSDPESVGKLFADYDTIIETGRTLKNAGYRVFASDAETQHFKGQSSWVVDGALNVDQQRFDFMDLAAQLYQEDLTAYASQWTAPWYQAMSGPVPILNAEIQGGVWDTDENGDPLLNVWDEENFNANVENYSSETAEVFAFGLPAWGVLTLRDNVGETSGLWGVCSGPSYGYDGGTYIGISDLSENKELAWEFVKFCTLNEEVADWWIEASQGDTVSLISALEKHAEDENETYGGQKLYKFWLEQAEGINLSNVTEYDTAIDAAWSNAITAVKTGEKSKEDAVAGFYDEVAATYPDLEITR
ncbi:MAG: extracellular solute-binding protein [Lachnospiraceae bacterium]|nr:extracellular solute-binding protein [Lachnospiraceae bacterium]